MNLPFEHARLPGDSHFAATAIAADLRAVRERAPLVHNVTNFVVIQQTANALLALGASPIMAHAEEELDEFLAYAGSLGSGAICMARTHSGYPALYSRRSKSTRRG
jgi:hypothetical protein